MRKRQRKKLWKKQDADIPFYGVTIHRHGVTHFIPLPLAKEYLKGVAGRIAYLDNLEKGHWRLTIRWK